MYETIKYPHASIKMLYCITIYSEPCTTSLQNLYISKANELVKSQKAHKSQKSTMTRNNFYHHRQNVTMQLNEIKTILHVKPLGTIPFCHFRPVYGWHYPMIHTLTAPGHETATCDFESTHQYSKPRIDGNMHDNLSQCIHASLLKSARSSKKLLCHHKKMILCWKIWTAIQHY